MNDIEKLRVLLPHWIEHNGEHATEFVRWAERAASAGHREVAEPIRSAAREMEQANAALRTALARLGGPMPLGVQDPRDLDERRHKDDL
jgi:hypothetical protein